MIRMRNLIMEPRTYLWVDVVFIRETPRAILIAFDEQKAWIPKVWIARIKHNAGASIKIKILGHHWAKKFA